jgi:hypothetical protein
MNENKYQIDYKILVLIHCFLPIFLGGILYILFRSSDLKMFQWFKFCGLENLIFHVRSYLCELKYLIPSWSYYSIPNALWVYSFTSSLLLYWHNNSNKYFWVLIPFMTGVFVEILQLFNLFPGSFDYLDLTFASLSFILSILIINYKMKNYEKTIF